MIDKIEVYPVIPDALRQAALKKTIVPFIGAGVSQLGGCPGWTEFANAALNFFVQKGKLSHAQLDQIASLSSRVKLSLALELEKQHEIAIDFVKLLKPTDDNQKLGDEVYANLLKLATTFVTTNYDSWLHQSMPATYRADVDAPLSKESEESRQLFYKYHDITVENLGVSNSVFHLHGSVKDRSSMVITTTDYLERYSSHRIDVNENHENPFLTFLEMLFRLKNVLFIGYGLNELEILEYVIQKGIQRQAISDEEPRHYVLQGFFSHEVELARSLESYFRPFGIGLLPFSRDELDWNQLVEVIEYFVQEIPPGQGLALSERHEMEELLK